MYEQTPTPWTAEKAYGEWNVYDSEEKVVAAIHADDDQREIAHLLAASYEMREALKLIVAYVREEPPKPYSELVKFMNVADAAIAKAEGRP